MNKSAIHMVFIQKKSQNQVGDHLQDHNRCSYANSIGTYIAGAVICFAVDLVTDYRSIKSKATGINCLYGLGEHKEGIWKQSVGTVASLGPDPAYARRIDHAPIGLYNYGATCYLNSLLQCLFHILPFRALVFAWCEPSTAKDVEGKEAMQRTLMYVLRQLFGQMQFSLKSATGPRPLVQTLNLAEAHQQDAHEFFKLFLSMLSDVYSRQPHPMLRSVIPKMFTGKLQYVTRCKECQYMSPHMSEYTELVSAEELIRLCSLLTPFDVTGAASTWL